MKLAIVSPGRTGTTVLAQTLWRCGFNMNPGAFFASANAGLEEKVGAGSDSEVMKDPWASQYLDDNTLAGIDYFLVPIRRLEDSAISRIAVQRAEIASRASDESWDWAYYGDVAGGCIFPLSYGSQEASLSTQLWDLLLKLAEAGKQPIFIAYPRFVVDFDYFWSTLGFILEEKCTAGEALKAWKATVRTPAKSKPSKKITRRELELLKTIEVLRRKLREQSVKRS